MLCCGFYDELTILDDKHLLALYVATVSDGAIGYGDAFKMSAHDLYQTIDFLRVFNKEVEKNKSVSFTRIRELLK